MAVEIERKFLVVGGDWRAQAQRSQRLVQGYLTTVASPRAAQPNVGAGCSVRVRVGGARAWLNIKSAIAGIERREYEYAIPVADAERMLAEFCPVVVEKVRHDVPYEGATFEVDEFLGENSGLVVAELELQSPTDQFARPPWLGRDVSNRPRYYNVHLLQHPFSRWNARERAGE